MEEKNRTKESARFSCSLEFLYCLTKFVKPQRGGINKRESTSEIATVLIDGRWWWCEQYAVLLKTKILLIVNVTPNYKGIDAYFLCDTEIIGSRNCKFDTLTNKAQIDKQNYPL